MKSTHRQYLGKTSGIILIIFHCGSYVLYAWATAISLKGFWRHFRSKRKCKWESNIDWDTFFLQITMCVFINNPSCLLYIVFSFITYTDFPSTRKEQHFQFSWMIVAAYISYLRFITFKIHNLHRFSPNIDGIATFQNRF